MTDALRSWRNEMRALGADGATGGDAANPGDAASDEVVVPDDYFTTADDLADMIIKDDEIDTCACGRPAVRYSATGKPVCSECLDGDVPDDYFDEGDAASERQEDDEDDLF